MTSGHKVGTWGDKVFTEVVHSIKRFEDHLCRRPLQTHRDLNEYQLNQDRDLVLKTGRLPFMVVSGDTEFSHLWYVAYLSETVGPTPGMEKS
jgi:hypothetical protein